jgi:charged multivesicular body protein 7
VGGAEGVEEVVGRLREQMEAADEVGSILAEAAGSVVVDEGEIDDELAAMVGEESSKAEEAERKRREAEAEETRKRLEAAGDVPQAVKLPQEEEESEKEVRVAEDMMSRMSLGAA